MANRTIEETFQSIRPRRGIPAPAVIGVGVSSAGGDLSSSLSQAGLQIAQLQSVYQQQAALISANTQAILNNTSSRGQSAASTVAHAATGFLGGGLGLLSPLISGIAHLFGGGNQAPQVLPTYVPPPPVSISAGLTSGFTSSPLTPVPPYVPPAVGPGTVSDGGAGSSWQPANSQAGGAQAPQITVHVNAMDSQSFMDRSSDIANAVREAMLNMHPINDVINSL